MHIWSFFTTLKQQRAAKRSKPKKATISEAKHSKAKRSTANQNITKHGEAKRSIKQKTTEIQILIIQNGSQPSWSKNRPPKKQKRFVVLKSGQDGPKGGRGVVLGWSWAAWGWSGGRSGGDLGACGVTISSQEQQREARAIQSSKKANEKKQRKKNNRKENKRAATEKETVLHCRFPFTANSGFTLMLELFVALFLASSFWAFRCPKGSSWEAFWEPKSVPKAILEQLWCKTVIFQKSAYFLGGSTIFEVWSASKSIKNGSNKVLERYLLHLVLCHRFWSVFAPILVPFWGSKWSQVGAKIGPKMIKKSDILQEQPESGPRAPKSAPRAPQESQKGAPKDPILYF